MNFPDLICLLHYDWKSTAFSRVTRLAEKKKKKKKKQVVLVNTVKKCIRIQSQQEKKNRR